MLFLFRDYPAAGWTMVFAGVTLGGLAGFFDWSVAAIYGSLFAMAPVFGAVAFYEDYRRHGKG